MDYPLCIYGAIVCFEDRTRTESHGCRVFLIPISRVYWRCIKVLFNEVEESITHVQVSGNLIAENIGSCTWFEWPCKVTFSNGVDIHIFPKISPKVARTDDATGSRRTLLHISGDGSLLKSPAALSGCRRFPVPVLLFFDRKRFNEPRGRFDPQDGQNRILLPGQVISGRPREPVWKVKGFSLSKSCRIWYHNTVRRRQKKNCHVRVICVYNNGEIHRVL